MQDPISGREYEQTLEGFLKWASNELPYGVPLLYAVVGFVTITALATLALNIGGLIFQWTPSEWSYVVVLAMGVLWSYGGWLHGVEAESELDTEAEPYSANVDF